MQNCLHNKEFLVEAYLIPDSTPFGTHQTIALSSFLFHSECEYIIWASRLAQLLMAILMEPAESDQSRGNLLAELLTSFFGGTILYTIICINSTFEMCLI